MSAPFELLAGPVDVYLAVTGTGEPAIDAPPPGAWVKLGAAGSKDYDDGQGVIVRPEQTIQTVGGLGATGDRKAFRDKEKLVIEFTLNDATVEAYANALNQAAITTIGAAPARKKIALLQGQAVAVRSMLIRGPAMSSYADSANALQWWIPLVFQNGNPESVYMKAKAVGLKLQFVALQDDVNGFGNLSIPTA
jgi:hypothetical protein